MTDHIDLVRQLLALPSPADTKTERGSYPWKVGTAYLIRTVTFTWTGRLIAVSGQELLLEKAAWIADTGRYSAATRAESLSEVESREGPVIIGRGSVVDAVEWTAELPRTVK